MSVSRAQQPITPQSDLREMLRNYVVTRSMACMEHAAKRREEALSSSDAFAAYRETIRTAVRGFFGQLPAGPQAIPPEVTLVSRFEYAGYRTENVLFETYPGWQVNATVYIPLDFQPPFPAVIVPVGHSGKQMKNYQLPCQYFARSGYVAVCFDPPGVVGEKQPGNEHFNDGVRDYLLGQSSSRYFVSDALRCIDYLETRKDVDLSRGVAMTGVSGGGTTTTFAALLDERITVIGPSCCVTPLADLDISQCYCGCPETHQLGRYAAGIDEVDLICAAAPTPCLLMAGAEDSVFRIEDTRRLAELVARSYASSGVAESFRFMVDPAGHAYTLGMAREFTRFMSSRLSLNTAQALPELSEESFALRPEAELHCSPRTDVNMRTRAVTEAAEQAAKWDCSPEAIRRAALAIVGLCDGATNSAVEAEVGPTFRLWSHNWQSVMLRPESGIELPGTLLCARPGVRGAAILHFDDVGRHRKLQRYGLLTEAIRLFKEDGTAHHLFSVDLRGWGDTAMAMYPYEMAGWGSLDRYLAYSTAALGDPIMAMRIRDALAALTWLRSRPEIDPERIVLTGSGLGSVVALHVAAIDTAVAGVVTWDGLSSFRSLLATECYPWSADAFLPKVLKHYDLPELAAGLSCPVHLFGLRDGSGGPASEPELAAYNYSHIGISSESTPAPILASLETLLRRKSDP